MNPAPAGLMSPLYRTTPSNLRFSGQVGTNKSEAWSSKSSLNGETGSTNFDIRHTITFNSTDETIFPHLSSDLNLLGAGNYRVFGCGGGYRTGTEKQKNLKLTGEYDYGFWNVDAKVKSGISRVVSLKDARCPNFTLTMRGKFRPSFKPRPAPGPSRHLYFEETKMTKTTIFAPASGNKKSRMRKSRILPSKPI